MYNHLSLGDRKSQQQLSNMSKKSNILCDFIQFNKIIATSGIKVINPQ